MTLHVLPDLLQGSEEWHDQRRGMVTASVVGRLITTRTRTAIEYGCSECGAFPGDPCVSKAKRGEHLEGRTPIKTVHPARSDAARFDTAPPELVTADNDDSRSLTALLVAERITGHTDPTFTSDDMLRGIEDEPRARDLYSEKYAPVHEVGFLVRDDWGFRIGYSPDGLVGDDGLIEVKAPRAKTHLRTILSDEVPPQHMPQLQCGLLVSGRKWIDFLSYSGGMPMWRKRVLPDERWFKAIVAAVEQFEHTAADMVAKYEAAVEGLPATERIDLEMVL